MAVSSACTRPEKADAIKTPLKSALATRKKTTPPKVEKSISSTTRQSDDARSPRKAYGTASQKLRSTVGRAMNNMGDFRAFLKPLFPTPNAAFDDLSGGQDHIRRALFVHRLDVHGFTGNASQVFDLMCDSQNCISRDDFQKRLSALQGGKQAAPFAGVVEIAARAAGLSAEDASKAAVVAEQVLKRSNSRVFPGSAGRSDASKRSNSRAPQGSSDRSDVPKRSNSRKLSPRRHDVSKRARSHPASNVPERHVAIAQ